MLITFVIFGLRRVLGGFAFHLADVVVYTDALHFIDWLCDHPMDSACFAKGNELRRSGPKLG